MILLRQQILAAVVLVAYVATVLLAVWGRAYWFRPIRLLITDRVPLAPKTNSIELPQLPPATSSFVVGAIRQFAEMGFVSRGTIHIIERPGKVESWTSLWVNEESAEFAQVLSTLRLRGGRVFAVNSLLFATDFTDGTTVATSTTPAAHGPSDPNVDYLRAGTITSVSELHRAHRLHVRHLQAERIPTLDRVPDTATRVLQRRAEKLERLREAGYVKFDARSQEYRTTVKGAILATYLYLWPLKQIRQRRLARELTEKLTQIGYHPTPLPPIPITPSQ